MIPGAKEAVQDADIPVSSIYTLPSAYKFSNLRQAFQGGKAIFHMPPLPVKCGGAPQKIMYLSECDWRRRGVRGNTDIAWYSAVKNLFPNCTSYADSLEPLALEKGISLNFDQKLVSVDGANRVATFENNLN